MLKLPGELQKQAKEQANKQTLQLCHTPKFRGSPGTNPPGSNVKTKQNEKPKLAQGDFNFSEHFMKILRQIVKYISLISTINILYM